jgi:hypothetical protein
MPLVWISFAISDTGVFLNRSEKISTVALRTPIRKTGYSTRRTDARGIRLFNRPASAP